MRRRCLRTLFDMASTRSSELSLNKETWPAGLRGYLEDTRTKRFSYGVWDCCLFAAGWIQIVTGVDPAAEFRGYTSQKEAYKIVDRFGSIQSMLSQALGGELVAAAQAVPGDIVLLRRPHMVTPEGLGICVGLYSVFTAARGLRMISTAETAGAWKIGAGSL
jgi:hypothetical protein